MLPQISLVLGGASSGKSSFAERLVISADLPKVYLATAQAFDTEMREKISDHKIDRGPNWTTIESPFEAASQLDGVGAGQVVLLDCATMWLTNMVLADHDVDAKSAHLLKAIQNCASPVVVVSNEIGMGIVPENELARRFRVAQGRLNAQLAQIADLAVVVMAGLPLALKGTLPGGIK
jgi:adenosylcobinamide kinase/adenosylcobinamide-phosphate guanylyltransferase